MERVSIQRAQQTLSQLIEKVALGKDVVITRGQRPVARLVAFTPDAVPQRRFGALKWQVAVTASFSEPLPDSEF